MYSGGTNRRGGEAAVREERRTFEMRNQLEASKGELQTRQGVNTSPTNYYSKSRDDLFPKQHCSLLQFTRILFRATDCITQNMTFRGQGQATDLDGR